MYSHDKIKDTIKPYFYHDSMNMRLQAEVFEKGLELEWGWANKTQHKSI